MSNTPIALTIAGSDSGGGAGIQADIKAMSATGSYACSVITALTAQNTLGVTGVLPVADTFIQQQFDAVFSDLDIKAVKIGMLGDVATIKAVAAAIKKYQPAYVVLDPVMVATSGDLLLETDAVDTLIKELLPLAHVITPNLHEANALLGRDPKALPQSDADMREVCQQLMSLGCQSVLLKGGHQEGDMATDYWQSADEVQTFSHPRIATENTHGTGCTLSASIASYLAQGASMAEAIRQSKDYLHGAIAHANDLEIGAGAGPVHHFFRQNNG
ncbi:MAG: bifunctional hydroxymethylpyrimidine kinase/phosphomethylpyrimidine kinase [Pontibacterium sp.]